MQGVSLFSGAIPDTIADYDLLEKIGSGGMGVVYRSRQRSADRLVALKLIRPDRLEQLVADRRVEAVERFQIEARAAARLTHDNIVPVYDVGEFEGIPFYSMRYVEGRSLADVLQAGPLSNRQAAIYAEPIARAVQYAHGMGILHRDLKPRNILVDAQDRPYVADFGLAKWLMEGHAEVTHTGQVMGTPEYMSPEQARDSSRVAAASDVYSLGATLYELLTGRPPFRASTPVETLRQVLSEDPVAPRLLNPAIDADLETISLKCLEKEPDRRYESAGSVAADLLRYLKGEPILARPLGRTERLRRWRRRNPRVAALSAAVLLLLASIAVTSTIALIRIAAGKRAALAAEARATRSAEEAKAVTSFLVDDLLAEASPENNPLDREITVREALDKAADKVDSAFAKQPEVEVAVRRIIGQTYQSLSIFPSAEEHFRTALALSERVHGVENLATLEMAGDLGLLLLEEGKPAEAEPLMRENLKAFRETLGPEHPATLTAMNNLSLLLQAIGKKDEAESLARETLTVRKRILGQDNENTLMSAGNLGMFLVDRGKPGEAEPFIREAADGFAGLYGLEHPLTLIAMNNLGMVLHQQGKLTEAVRIHRQTLESRRHVLGPDHINTVASMGNLGKALLDAGRYTEAESLLTQTVEKLQRTVGREHGYYLSARNNLGLFYYRSGRLDEAERIHRETLAVRRRVLGVEHDHTIYSVINLAQTLQAMRRYDEAEALFSEALDLRRRTRPADHPDIAAALAGLGSVLADAGDTNEGERLLNEALESCRRSLPPGHQQIGNTTSLLGECLIAQHRYDEAESLLVSGYRIVTEAPGVPLFTRVQALHRLVTLYEAWGKRDKALEWRLQEPEAVL